MIEFVEVLIKVGFEPWKRVAVLHPSYKKGQVQHRFLWWKWTTIEYVNIDEEEIRIVQFAYSLARSHAKTAALARVVKYTHSNENSSAHVATWLGDFDGRS